MREPRRRRNRSADGSTPPHRRSFAKVATLTLLVLVVGAGAAYAGKKLHHYLLSSTSQIKPSVLAQLHGSNGANGTNGTNGTTGNTGPTGGVGPQGPGAEILSAKVSAFSVSSPVGSIPIELSCNGNGANTDPSAQLLTTETGGLNGVTESGGGYYNTSLALANGGTASPTFYTGSYNGSPGTALNAGGFSNDAVTQAGTILLTHFSGLFSTNFHPSTLTETVTYRLNVVLGTGGGDGSCSIDAQIVPTS